MGEKLSIEDLSLQGKKVLMRVDFNVPLDKSGQITDDSRIVASLPSIQYVLAHGGALILMSHLGRPKQRSSELSLAPCAKRLSQLLKVPVLLAPDCIGTETEKMARDLKGGQVLLLENLRFHPAEEKPESDPSFAKKLASLGDVYINDAFGTAHRAHSSTASIAQYFPDRSAAGFLLQKEIQFLGKTLTTPQKPFVAIIGGAKISSKVGALKSLVKKVDSLLIGGGMAFTFLKAQGIAIGGSLFEKDYLDTCQELILFCRSQNVTLQLPQDLVIADRLSEDASSKIIDLHREEIPSGYQGVDIGPKTIESFKAVCRSAKTIFWNGPLGVFEIPQFAKGTYSIAKALAEQKNATTIIGGGDSVAAIEQMGMSDQFSHLSTGGGASLEYIEFGTLPGIEALTNKQKVKIQK